MVAFFSGVHTRVLTCVYVSPPATLLPPCVTVWLFTGTMGDYSDPDYYTPNDKAYELPAAVNEVFQGMCEAGDFTG